MRGTTHMVCSATATGLTMMCLGNDTAAVGAAMAAAVVGGLLPDIDIERSKATYRLSIIQKHMRRASLALTLCAFAVAILTYATTKKFPMVELLEVLPLMIVLFFLSIEPHKYLTHRGITHTGIICLIWAAVAHGCPKAVQPALIGFALGWFYHVVADMFNGKGVPLFWPLMKGKIHVAKIRSSSTLDTVFMIVWAAICIIAMVLVGGRV